MQWKNFSQISLILADMLETFSRRFTLMNCIIFLADLADFRRSAFPILCALCVFARKIPISTMLCAPPRNPLRSSARNINLRVKKNLSQIYADQLSPFSAPSASLREEIH
jgi:hypothetical protein